ncbi:MAG: hypothetical protein K8J08_03110 [Thermoanaerobaculia bacterium]|nr:hypothetical protein [Thermoanaerobaculia bacterium]
MRNLIRAILSQPPRNSIEAEVPARLALPSRLPLSRVVLLSVVVGLAAGATMSLASTPPSSCSEWTLELPAGGSPGDLIPLPAIWLDASESLSVVAASEGSREVALIDGLDVSTEQTQQGLWMVAPSHPESLAQGGPLQLVVRTSRIECEFSWQVTPRTASPGRTKSLLTALDSRLSQKITTAGSTPEALLTVSVDQQPPHLQLLAMQQLLLGQEGSAGGLWGTLEAMDPSEIAWLDALLPDDTLFSSVASTDFQPRPVAVIASSNPHWPVLEAGTLVEFKPDVVSIEDAEELAGYMTEANEAARRLDGATGKVFNDLALGVLSLAVVPTVITQGLAKFTVGLHFFLKTSIEWDSHLLPTEFSALEFELTKAEWSQEDDGTYTTWKKVRAAVRSRAWRLDLKLYDTLSLHGTPATSSTSDLLANLVDRPWSDAKPTVVSIPALTWTNILMEDDATF